MNGILLRQYRTNVVKREIANTVWEWIPSDTKLLNIGCGSSPISLNYTNMVGIDTNESNWNLCE